jgi:hypothetical protein
MPHRSRPGVGRIRSAGRRGSESALNGRLIDGRTVRAGRTGSRGRRPRARLWATVWPPPRRSGHRSRRSRPGAPAAGRHYPARRSSSNGPRRGSWHSRSCHSAFISRPSSSIKSSTMTRVDLTATRFNRSPLSRSTDTGERTTCRLYSYTGPKASRANPRELINDPEGGLIQNLADGRIAERLNKDIQHRTQIIEDLPDAGRARPLRRDSPRRPGRRATGLHSAAVQSSSIAGPARDSDRANGASGVECAQVRPARLGRRCAKISSRRRGPSIAPGGARGENRQSDISRHGLWW